MSVNRLSQHASSWRTEIFRSVGTLRCAEMLRISGATTTTRQMFLLMRFVIDSLGALREPSALRTSDVEAWTAERLDEYGRSWESGRSGFRDWRKLFERSQGILNWNPYREFADLLEVRHGEAAITRVASEASRSAGGPGMGFIMALAGDFREVRLLA